jgi:hypothetical protein
MLLLSRRRLLSVPTACCLCLLLWVIQAGSTDPPIHYIIGGLPATNGSYPYFALDLRPDGRFFCGGTLVSPEFILTAAHCAIGPFSLVRFFVGHYVHLHQIIVVNIVNIKMSRQFLLIPITTQQVMRMILQSFNLQVDHLYNP